MNKNIPNINLNDFTNLNYPKKMYKHYSLNDNSVNVLTGKENPYLYFSHPNQLNDILDGSMLLWDFKNLNQKYFSLILQGIYKCLGISNKDFIEQFTNDKLFESYQKSKNVNFEDLKLMLSFLNSFNTGVLSLTENCDNNLMWAHYSYDDGFVLELNINKLLESLKLNVKDSYIFPITYKKKLYSIDISKYIKFKNNELSMIEPVLYYISTKYKAWKYEKEWRVLITKDKLGHSRDKLDFITQKLRDKIFDQDVPTKQDIFRTDSRKIDIKKETISKIILGPYFFNNLYFSEICEENNKVFYLFKTSAEITENAFQKLQHFLILVREIKENYNDRIQQIGIANKTSVNGDIYIKRKVCFNIKIVELNKFMMAIEKSEIEI
ncbi:DUF2971 domain-containing protein [Gelidibacter mesophilus]|uniref:DUF2971 domain-containing protein n=1 Tax=Gelidibacter mesophilus TaxID=169050 RepID=UPI0003F851F2|nr:DUF2971 domain-containing protein [Gelidibacter mesophilus]